MNKPQAWETTEAAGERKILPAGGYVLKIQGARIEQTKDGKEVLVLAYDIVEGDYKWYYTELYDKRVVGNLDAKWPGVYRQLTEGKSLPFFKGLITAVEESNPGFVWNWDEATLKNKLFGGLFGEEEYRGNDGNVHTNVKLRFPCSIDRIRKGDFKVPDPKRMQGASSFGADVKNDESFNF